MAEIVYVLSNPAMPGILKIGKTDKDNVELRMKELYTTSVPLPFDCVYACIVDSNEDVEKAMHETFEKQRVNPRREFFKLSANRAVKALKHYEVYDVTPGFRANLDANLLDDEKDARRKVRYKLQKADPQVAKAKDLHSTIKKSTDASAHC
jgi:hypothetical protein